MVKIQTKGECVCTSTEWPRTSAAIV